MAGRDGNAMCRCCLYGRARGGEQEVGVAMGAERFGQEAESRLTSAFREVYDEKGY